MQSIEKKIQLKAAANNRNQNCTWKLLRYVVVYLSIMLLEVVISAEMINIINWRGVVFPLPFLLIKFMPATPKRTIAEPTICQTPAFSLKMMIARTKERTAERRFVTVTTEISTSLSTFKTKYQLSASKNPFSAKMGINFKGIETPKGIHIRLNKKAVVVNNINTTDSPLFLSENFLKTL